MSRVKGFLANSHGHGFNACGQSSFGDVPRQSNGPTGRFNSLPLNENIAVLCQPWFRNPARLRPSCRVEVLARGNSLERTQEIDDCLLLLSAQVIEIVDNFISLTAFTLVISNGINQVGGTSIVEEKDALSNAPEWSRPELVRTGATLCNSVGQSFAHMVDQQVRKKIHRLLGKRNTRSC